MTAAQPAGAVGTPRRRRLVDRAALWLAWALVRYFEHQMREQAR